MKRILCAAAAALSLLFVSNIQPAQAVCNETACTLEATVQSPQMLLTPSGISFISPAQAQSAIPVSPTAVDVGGIYGGFRPYIVDIVGSLITLGVGWLLVLLKSKFNLDIDASHRDALQSALTNGAGLALNKLGNSLQGKSIEVGNPAVASAVNLVLKSAPDALAHFGITPQSVAEKIVAKLPQVANTVTPPAGNA